MNDSLFLSLLSPGPKHRLVTKCVEWESFVFDAIHKRPLFDVVQIL